MHYCLGTVFPSCHCDVQKLNVLLLGSFAFFSKVTGVWSVDQARFEMFWQFFFFFFLLFTLLAYNISSNIIMSVLQAFLTACFTRILSARYDIIPWNNSWETVKTVGISRLSSILTPQTYIPRLQTKCTKKTFFIDCVCCVLKIVASRYAFFN